jgi:hypothetical protein
MGLILNLRGTSGAGKTELARLILAEYGWRRQCPETHNRVEPVYRAARDVPFAYRLRHPRAGRPLVVIGHYQVTSGGCDTIRAQDGGLAEALRFAGDVASSDHDVLIEGLRLSSEVELSAKLAAQHLLHILRLSTPVEQCVTNLVSRRRVAKSRVRAIEGSTVEEHIRVEDACARLRLHATVEVLNFSQALARAKALFGIA